MWPGLETVHLGVLRVQVAVPGARSLKDRRRVVIGLRDRIRARFDVSCHDVTGHDLHGHAALLVTTGGNEASLVRSSLDRIRALVASSGDVIVTDVIVEVRAWPDPAPWREEEEE